MTPVTAGHRAAEMRSSSAISSFSSSSSVVTMSTLSAMDSHSFARS